MSIGVGTGDYAEYLPFVPLSSPAFLFIREGIAFTALLASDMTTWEARANGGAADELDGWADSAGSVDDVAIDSSGASQSFSDESNDGAMNFTRTPGDTFASVIVGRIIFRDGEFGVVVIEPDDSDGSIGGLWTSADRLTYTRTNFLPVLFEFGRWRVPFYWTRTASHVYFLTPDNSNATPSHSLQVDSPIGSPEVQRIQHSGTVTGGTFALGQASPDGDIAWNADAATVKALLETPGIPVFPFSGLSVSVVGTLAGGMDITFPFNGDQALIFLEDGNITGGGGLTITETTAGTSGIKTYPSTITPIELFGSFAGDVVIAYLQDTPTGNPILEKYVNTTVTDVLPGFAVANSVFRLLRSPNGTTWIGSYTDNVTGDTQLVRSTDSGNTWSLVGPVSAFGIVAVTFDPVVANKWWALILTGDAGFAYEGTLYVSTDNGANWSDFGADIYYVASGEAGSEIQICPLGGKTN